MFSIVRLYIYFHSVKDEVFYSTYFAPLNSIQIMNGYECNGTGIFMR